MTNIPVFVQNIAYTLSNLGMESYLVGGYVRDYFMGQDSDDIDICIVGCHNPADVETVLNQFGQANFVGVSFPVWKITDPKTGQEYDFALARTERKVGQSRQDFAVNFSPEVSIEDDLKRRDFTINAIAINVLTGVAIDPFNGRGDIALRILRPVSSAFAEDALRVYRAARFLARFSMQASPELIEVCTALNPNNISAERIGMELDKCMKQAPESPSIFFRFLREIDWLGYHFQEVEDLIGIQQNPEYHPEGDAFEHTMHCLDASQDAFIRIVMLCHDLGKATTTLFEDGKWKAPAHAGAGVQPSLDMLKRIKFKDGVFQDQVACLVENHMFHILPEFSRKAVGRMANKLAAVGLTFEQLVEVCRCDLAGRPPLETPEVYIGQDIAAEFIVNAEKGFIEPIVNGNMLIGEGIAPGPELGRIKDHLFDLQSEGILTGDNWKSFL